MDDLQRENQELHMQLAQTHAHAGHTLPFQHQPYAPQHQKIDPPLHRLEDASLPRQMAAEALASSVGTPRGAERGSAAPMLGLKEENRGRPREPGVATPEKLVQKRRPRTFEGGPATISAVIRASPSSPSCRPALPGAACTPCAVCMVFT